MLFNRSQLLLMVIMCTGTIDMSNIHTKRSTSIILVEQCGASSITEDVEDKDNNSSEKLTLISQKIKNHVSHADFEKLGAWNSSTEERSNRVQSRASPGVSYHEFLINEASYKFWAIFQLVTVVVLLYSTFAAIYYARYNYLQNLESGQYDDLLFARSISGNPKSLKLNAQTFQRIVDSISGN